VVGTGYPESEPGTKKNISGFDSFMTGFLTRLINRHLNPSGNLSPVARGRFEPESSSSVLLPDFRDHTLIESSFESKKDLPARKTGKKSDLISKVNEFSVNENSTLPAHKLIHDIHAGSKKTSEPALNDLTQILNPDKTGNEFINDRDGEKGIISRSPDQGTKTVKDNLRIVIKEPHNPVIPDPAFRGIVVVNDSEKPVGSGQNNLENPVTVVQPLVLNPAISDYPDRFINQDLFPENNEGILQPPTWSGSSYKELMGEKFLKKTEVHSSPVIKVHIGRIEVKAVMQQNVTPPQPFEYLKPGLSLDDYLTQQNSGKK
jgi:hypothetical protein